MKYYTVTAESEAEKQHIEATIARIGLKEKLDIRHQQDLSGCCPLEVHCEVRDGTKYTNIETTDLKEGLLILVKDATDPAVAIIGCRRVSIPSPAKKLGLMLVIFEDVAIHILFKGSKAWGIENN